jgi:flagellar hook-associated protein 1 FlgK
MASLVDINVIDNGGSNLTINLTSGQTVVDGITNFSFAYEQGKTVRQLSASSISAGSDAQCYYSGSDSSEYTIQVVTPGTVTSNGSATGATFKVSLDGGETWLTDDSGNVLTYDANAESGKVMVGDLEIWFGTTSNASSVTGSTTLTAGDTFTLVPKKALNWYTSAGTSEIVSPQQYSDGTDNTRRLTGGSLCGALELVDSYIGGYEDSLDSFTESLVWEVNRIYSQGTGEAAYDTCTGTYSALRTDVGLGDPASGLTYGNRWPRAPPALCYSESTGSLVSSASITLDPASDSLEDVANAINNAFGGNLTASIVNGQLLLDAADGYEFRFGDDTPGCSRPWGSIRF